MLSAINKVDPKKTVKIGGYRLDTDGNAPKKIVKLAKSETFLTELMENICKLFVFGSNANNWIDSRNVCMCLCVFKWFDLTTGDKLDDYAKARFKSNGAMTLMKLTNPDGGMNPDMGSVDFIQDGDLNKSLKHFVSVLNKNQLKLLIRLKRFLKIPNVCLLLHCSAWKCWKTTKMMYLSYWWKRKFPMILTLNCVL